MSGEPQAPKVILWAVPRSVSTALTRAMHNKKDMKVYLEPYANPFYFGPERSSSRLEKLEDRPEETFQNVTVQLEKETKTSNPTFVKDMAKFFAGKMDTTEHLPKGYTHTFIIRNPKKAIHSMYKISVSKDASGWNSFDASETGYPELYNMLQLVTEQLGQEPIVIDADDLIDDPETMLKLYCEKTGIGYEPSMLEWKDAPQKMENYHTWSDWFTEALSTPTFKKPGCDSVSDETIASLPTEVQICINNSIPFYNKMHAMRLKPSSCAPS